MDKMNSGILHASCVSWQGRGVLILGASGSGKSSLALELMAFGCTLVADDRTQIETVRGKLVATCPDPIRGQIEARGVGILSAEASTTAGLICAVDLDQDEPLRLPAERYMDICGRRLRLFHKPATRAFPAAILQYLKTTPL